MSYPQINFPFKWFTNLCTKLFLFIGVHKCFACLYLRAEHACSSNRDQKRASDPLGIKPGSSARAASALAINKEPSLYPLSTDSFIVSNVCLFLYKLFIYKMKVCKYILNHWGQTFKSFLSIKIILNRFLKSLIKCLC